jgi:tetratricopeptide (TPR) repeat protein
MPSSGHNSQLSWIIRNHKGQILGPLTTKEVLSRISDGSFQGDEMISAYPDGKWVSLSKEPEFYDRILEILEKKANEAGYKKPPQKERRTDFEETIFMPPPLQKPQPEIEARESILKPRSGLDGERPFEPLPKIQVSPTEPIIELSPVDDTADRSVRRKKLLFFSAIILIAAMVFLLLEPKGEKSDRIRLLRPLANQPEMAAEQVKVKLQRTLAAFEKSTVEDTLRAQNSLVSLIEGQTRNLEARGMLCFIYKELWPFSFQDPEDQKTIELMTQSTRALNLTSPYGQLCETIRLLVVGRYREARAQIDALLESGGMFSLLPFSYYVKGEILEADRDFDAASAYYEKSGQMWETWARPFLAAAELSYKNKKYKEAFDILQTMKPQHANNKERFVILGLIEIRGFSRKESALKILDSALAQPGLLKPSIESEGWYALAELWLEKNSKKRALQAAQRAYNLMPQNKLARDLVIRLGGEEEVKDSRKRNQEMVLLGDQYYRQGDCLSAQAEYKAAFEANPKNAEAAMKAGRCLWQLNQVFDSIDWLNKAIRADPKLIEAYTLQADYLSRRYDFVKATEILNRAQSQSSQSYEVLRGFAWLEFRKNNMIGAIQYGERAKSQFEGDVETYVLLSKAYRLRALAIPPDNNKLVQERELAIKNMKSYATRAVELDSTNTEAQIVYAEMLAAQHGVDTGIQYYNELIKKFAYTADYRLGLAKLLRAEERFSQARDIYEQVQSADPKNKEALLGLGQCQRALGLNEQALKTFLQAAIADPSDAESFFYAGQTLTEMNRFVQAIDNFKKALKINPYYPRIFLSIGRAYLAKGDLDEAKKAAIDEKSRNPNLSDPYILAAEVDYAQKQFADCAAEYGQAIKLRPQGAELYVKAARCYRLSSSIEVAQDMLSLAKQRENGYAEIYREQGALFQLKGDNEAALEAYQIYLELAPNAPDRDQVVRIVKQLGG